MTGWNRIRYPRAALTGLVVALVAVATLPLAASAQATHAHALLPGDAPGSRTYGNLTSVSFNGTTGFGEYFGNVTYGFVVNLTETNTTANQSEIFVTETVGVSLEASFCRPTCGSPQVSTSFRYVAYEVRDAWANVTTEASVVEGPANGSSAMPVPALGILNAAVRTRGGVTESIAATFAGNATTPSETYSALGQAAYRSHSNVTFSPALGLFPMGPLFPGQTWTSTSQFDLAAAWAADWSLTLSGPHGSFSTNGTSGAAVGPLTGTITLSGMVEPGPLGNASNSHVWVDYRVSAGDLLFAGPLVIGARLPSVWGGGFGGGWDAAVGANAQVNEPSMELGYSTNPYARVDASSVQFSTAINDSTGSAHESASGLGTSTLLGAPMTVSGAAALSVCLQSGTCATTASSPPGGGPWALSGFAAVALLAAVAVGAITGAVWLIHRHGRHPPSGRR